MWIQIVNILFAFGFPTRKIVVWSDASKNVTEWTVIQVILAVDASFSEYQGNSF